MRRYVITATTLMALAACGGGGGDAGGGQLTPVAPLALTSANYVQASQEVLSRLSYLSDLASLATGAEVANEGAMFRLVVNQALEARRWFGRAGKAITGVTVTSTMACDSGGSLTATIDDLNGNDDADTGDSARVSFSNCAMLGVTVNGALTINFTSVTGSIGVGAYSASIAVTADNLIATSSASRSTGNGRINIAVSGNGAISSTLTVTVPSFALNSTYGSVASSGTMTDFSISVVTTPVGLSSSSSTTLSGGVSSSGLDNKSITITTVRPFVQASSASYPSSGQVIFTGAANSKLRITAQSATTVQIELDADGNGSYETTTTRLWSQII